MKKHYILMPIMAYYTSIALHKAHYKIRIKIIHLTYCLLLKNRFKRAT